MSMDEDDFRRLAEMVEDSIVWFKDNDGINRRCVDARELVMYLERAADIEAAKMDSDLAPPPKETT